MSNGIPAKRRILIADDSLSNRLLIKKAFCGEYDIVEAENGVQALQQMKSGGISAVLLDLLMPVLDGYGVLKAIREDERLRDIPVIVITVSADEDSQVRALDAGAFDVMIKPINPKVALHRVKSILSRWEARMTLERNLLLEKQLRESELDAKTGLYTQQAFCRKVQDLLRNHPDRRYVLLRFDIDNFKLYNDAFGMEAGDKLLAYIGKFCQTHASSGNIYGHYDADHFIVCIERSLFSEEKLLSLLSQVEASQHGKFELTGRIGIYAIDDPSLPVALMCDRALLALKSIKGDYTRRIAYYSDDMRNSLIEEQQIINEMASALESGQFTVYLQPQYNQADMTLYGAEALVRWQHPQKGLIAPGKFIPIFERNGFISQLGRYMLEQVCRLQRAWLDAGLSVVPISVNVSRRDIYGGDLCDFIVDTLKKYAIAATLVPLEITESAYMESPRQMIEVVEKLRSAGFSIEMDDFGSGYSSLNTLKDVPVDVLKLDMQFLSDGIDGSRGGSILSSVVRMAHWLKLPVIAEGVETKKQADFLKSIGCFYIQGYYYDRPMPAQVFEERLRTHKPDILRDHRFTEDIKGAADFLSAATQSALLFNSFVGGAGIIEYDGENVEGLRFNDAYFEAVRIPAAEYQNVKLHMRDRFDAENWGIFTKAIREAIDTCDESACEIQTKPLGTRKMPIWTRVRMRYLAQNEHRYILYISVDNIDARMRLLRKNTELSEHLSTVMDSVPGGILDFEARENMRITFANETLATMFGYTHDEYMRMFALDPFSLIHPDERTALIPKAKAFFSAGNGFVNQEYRHICKDGSYKWVRLSSKLIRTQDGTCHGSGIVMNIDEEISLRDRARKQAQQLNKNHLALKALYDTIPCGIMEFTMTEGALKLADFNDSVWTIFGYASREDYVSAQRGKSPLMHAHPDERDDVERSIRAVLRGEERRLKNFEHRIIRADGSVGWLRLYMQKTAYADRASVLQCVFIDITDQKRADSAASAAVSPVPPSANASSPSALVPKEAHALASRELERYRLAFDQAGIACFEVDFIDGTLYATEAFARYAMSACAQAGIFCSTGDKDFVHPDDVGKLNVFNSADAGTGDHPEIVLRLKMTDGGFRHTRLIVSFIRDARGKALRAVGTLIDVNEETRARESQKELSQRLSHIVENIPSGIAIYELRQDGVYPVYISDQTCRMFGFTHEEYDLRIANGEKTSFIPDQSQYSPDDMPRLMRGESVLLPRLRAKRKDGSAFWLSAVAHMIRQDAGAPLVYTVLSDVTREVDSERLIESQNKELAAVIGSVPGGIFKYSARTDAFAYVSDTLLSMLGYSMEEFKQKFHNKFSEMVWREDRAAALDKIRRDIAANGDTDSCEYRVETKSGKLKWVYDAGRLITDADGEQWYIVVVIDHDEKKKYETRLAELNSQTSALIKNTPGGVTRYRVNKNRVSLDYVSEGFLAMLGYDKDELTRLLDADIFGLVHPDERADVTREFNRMIAQGASVTHQYRLKKRAEGYLWVTVTGNYIGEPGHGFCYMSYTDISKLKQMEEALSSEGKRLDNIIRNIPGGLAVFRVTDGAVKRVYVSDTAKRILGYRESDAPGNDVDIGMQRVYPDDVGGLLSAISRSTADKRVFRYDYRQLDADGGIRWVNLTANPVTGSDGSLFFYGIYTEIAEGKPTPAKETEAGQSIPETLATRLIAKDAELLGLIDMDTGALRVFLCADDDGLLFPGEAVEYASACRTFAEKRVEPRDRAEALRTLSLQTIKEKLGASGALYRCALWVKDGGKAARKSWIFTYADETRHDVIVMRVDMADTFSAAEKNELALRHALEEVKISYLDAVTGLYNRAATEREITGRLMKSGENAFALLMVDIDDLKHINDTCGHPQGDQALAAIARVFRQNFRDTDIIGRIGGDEFMVFVDGIKDESALHDKLAKVISEVNETCVGIKSDFPVHCSIGGTLSDGQTGFDALYNQADKALYQAKKNGKNRFCFYKNTSDARAQDGGNA